jgi:KUP system potassium uptake protein
MLVTTVLSFFVVRGGWHYPLALCVAVTAFFAAVDLAFFAAAVHKVLEGGWFPLALGTLVFLIMMTWRRGRARLYEQQSAGMPPLTDMLTSLFRYPPARVPGTAVFLTSSADATPNALLHSLKHYQVLHETNVFLTVEFAGIPMIDAAHRVRCESLPGGCWRVQARYGFMEAPDVAHALELCGPAGLEVDPGQVSYFLSREKIVPCDTEGRLRTWQARLFAAMARNAGSITDFFNIPPNRVVELGTRVTL